MVDPDDYPLLHYPDMMLAVLKTGREKPATLEDCISHIRDNLRRARVHISLTRDQLAERLARAMHHLAIAECIEPRGFEAYRVTDRGVELLENYPEGIDDSVLMNYREFRNFIEILSASSKPVDPGLDDYERGYNAFFDGKKYTDNPYDFDTRQHLSWENGWFEAADENAEK